MGFAIVAGGNPNMAVPVTGVLASSLAVGSTVKLMENNSAVDYLVVNQGIPGNSNLYDASCNGTWLLRKDIYAIRQWNDADVNTYANSEINTNLNGDIFSRFGKTEQATIKQIKIPYCIGNGSSTVKSGSNGLSCKIFLLSGYEAGWTKSDSDYFPVDGAKLDYFTTGSGGNSKRIAYQNGVTTQWWTRSPYTDDDAKVWLVDKAGMADSGWYASRSYGARLALILPFTAKFDTATMLLEGVA